jgi:hypothetical protein
LLTSRKKNESKRKDFWRAHCIVRNGCGSDSPTIARDGLRLGGRLSESLGVLEGNGSFHHACVERERAIAARPRRAVPIYLGEWGALVFWCAIASSASQKSASAAAAAAGYVSDGEAIVLDASTTCWHIARVLARRDLTVLTTGLYVALELLARPRHHRDVARRTDLARGASVVGDAIAACCKRATCSASFFGGRGLTLAGA